MKRTGKSVMAVLLAAVMVFMGCGRQNGEAADACKTKYAELVDEHNVVVGLYAGSGTEEYDGQLERLSGRMKEIGELDVGGMESGELDALLTEMENLMEEYEEIYQNIFEGMEEEEETEYCQVSVTLKNMTTVPFYEVYFYNLAQEDTRTNLVTDDPETYDGLEVYNLVNLVMEKGQTVWHLEMIDDEGNVIESDDVDLAPYDGAGVVIEMKYSFDTNEGWLDLSRV